MPSLSESTGWYEFIKEPTSTTHIIYLGENTYYVPEEGVTVEDFFNAVDRGQAYKLVRVRDVSEALKLDEAEFVSATNLLTNLKQAIGYVS